MKNILDAFRLDNKVALVTGSTVGMGAAIAEALAQAGAVVGLHERQQRADAGPKHPNIQAKFSADLSTASGPEELFQQVIDKFGQLDILVNNAGMIFRADAVDYSLEDFQRVLQVNLTSTFQLSQLAGRHLISRGVPGKIVNIASLLSFQGGIRVPAYAASKGGLAQLTKAFANEWASKNIQVNAIAPGYIATANTEQLRADPVRSRQILERIPAGRWGDPDDIAGAALFLASRASDYVTGHILVVDGGWLAR
jgi:2-deoxy-D-gluconate 3-dehydrogenase